MAHARRDANSAVVSKTRYSQQLLVVSIVTSGVYVIVLIIVVTLGSKAELSEGSAAFIDIRRSLDLSIILSNREMLSPNMLVDIDGAETNI